MVYDVQVVPVVQIDTRRSRAKKKEECSSHLCTTASISTFFMSNCLYTYING